VRDIESEISADRISDVPRSLIVLTHPARIECHVSFNHRQGLTTRLNTLTDLNPAFYRHLQTAKG